ncbi:hemolysin D [Rhodanobacter sp. ANJX3]|uniref:HlyD family type I secretion periplasmic adaptor subunit n=1 Tax=Rhodanobacter sp. ANJX3 TaxID=2723083 RepID=UPI00161541DA|nr:HlyD family type I secretion periplasmic adaptor subunit [Rhodanobacter sp. ANJX3]MBB5357371.1 hemolysin D [Rhodanobacter sp. ANJX3]
MSLRQQALSDLRERYTQVFKASWRLRTELDTVPRMRHENEFQPAALALRDTPMHPAPRVAMFVIAALLTVALAWACFGSLDIVATAKGKIVPTGEVKTIQSQDTAVVTAIHVVDGQQVKRGQPLLDLDATDAQTNAVHAQSDLSATRIEALRGRAMLDAIDKGHEPVLGQDNDLDRATAEAERHVLEGEYADYLSTVQEMGADIAQNAATLHEIDAQIRKLADTLPIEQKKEKDFAGLIVNGDVGLHDYYNEQQAVIQIQQDLSAERAKLAEAEATLDASQRKREAYIAQTRRTWLEKIHDDDAKAAGLVQDLTKAQQRGRLMRLLAPVDGTVQQLAVHTVGGVVTPAQVIMTLVPDQGPLMVEVTIDNQDIGFIKNGQIAEVKVETFPFTRYGTLHGTVVQVSNDAKQDDADKKSWVFTAQLALSQNTMQIEDREIRLTPGMTVTAEIKTGRRRIIGYLLSPLMQHARESLHER